MARLYILKCVLIVFIFSHSSCAVHDEFPFICFRSGCVSQAFNLKPAKKRLQARLNLNKRKRAAKKRGDQTESDDKLITQTDTIVEEGESVQYFKYLLVFYRDTANSISDTLLVVHSSAQKRIMDAGESAVEHLIRTRGVNNFQLVTFRQVRYDQADQTDSQASGFHRSQDIMNLLYRNGIPKRRVVRLPR